MAFPLPVGRPLTSDELLLGLVALGAEPTTIEHPPLYTVEDSQALRGEISGAHAKNLFVRDKKGKIFLLVLEESARVDLKRVHEIIGGAGRVSFGTPELLEEVLGVKPGSVTPLGAANDREGRATIVLDAALMRYERLNFHPLVNTRTTGLAREDFLKFLEAVDHAPMILPISS
jgi:Ala-tRNA(Pro) deacylase